MSFDIDIIEPCRVEVFHLDDDPESQKLFHAFIFWDDAKECARASADTPARAISQAYAARCQTWIGQPGEPLRPANVIEVDELIPTGRWTDLWLAIPFVLFLFLAFLMWEYL